MIAARPVLKHAETRPESMLQSKELHNNSVTIMSTDLSKLPENNIEGEERFDQSDTQIDLGAAVLEMSRLGGKKEAVLNSCKSFNQVRSRATVAHNNFLPAD
jgi:hypothetical protein